MGKRSTPPGFAPDDPTDSRELFEWQSKYPPEAKREIRRELTVLVAILVSVPVLLFLVWRGSPKVWFALDGDHYATFALYSYAWLAGMFGGTLFDLKWLYHSVARGIWHLDRRLWRMLTPFISGGLAFVVVTLISSGIFRIFDPVQLSRPPTVVGLSILVGIFSDTAFGKLAEIADTLFGATKRDSGGREPKPPEPPSRTPISQ
jgi:hypothetical protein